MKKRLYYKKWKQELREAMREEIDGDYLTEKMVRKMSISDKEFDDWVGYSPSMAQVVIAVYLIYRGN